MNLAGIDMNLLVVLDALLEERNVTRAGERVGLSQPATSNALNRLRHLLNDPILERDGRHMRLTERAHQLRGSLRKVLDDLRSVLTSPTSFDPQNSHFHIRIFASDYVTLLVLPVLRQRLLSVAPRAKVEVSWSDRGRVAELLERNEVDVAIGRFESTPPGIHRSVLFEDQYVVLAHRDHPIHEGELSIERMLSYPRIAVTFEGRNFGALEKAIAQAGGDVQCDVVVAHGSISPFLAALTDLVSISSRRVAETFSRYWPLASRPIPFEVASIPIEMMWHEHSDADPMAAWFRGELRALGQAFGSS